MTPRRRALFAIGALLLAAFLLRIVTWHQLRNMVWPDEIFNTLEQSHRVAFGYGMVPWEYRDGIRSWLLPGVLAGVMAFTAVFTSSVTAYLGACAGLLSAVSLVPVAAAMRTVLAELGLRAALVAGALLATWFELVYFAPKALSESVGGSVLVAGIVLAEYSRRPRTTREPPATTALCVAAALLALGALLRIHLALAALVGFLYLLRPLAARLRWRAVWAAAAVTLAVGLLDWITWDYPFSSYVENVRINVAEGKSAEFGVAPWTAYFEVYAMVWGPWGLGLLVLAALGVRAKPILGLCVVAVLATHIPIAHKEYRFMYPAMLLVLVAAAFGAAAVVRWLERRYSPRTATLAAAALVALWIGVSLQQSNDFRESKTQLAISLGEPRWHWELHRGKLLAMQRLHDDPTVCGVGLINIYVFLTGGYTYLHRDIPVYQVRNRDDVQQLAPRVNVYLVPNFMDREPVDEFGTYSLSECVDDVCIYRRPGACAADPGYHINRFLEVNRL